MRQAMRRVWLCSRERYAAIKRENNTCQVCHRKGSVAKGKELKIQVHHVDEIANWEAVIDAVYKNILVDPARLEVLCKDCHEKRHATVRE